MTAAIAVAPVTSYSSSLVTMRREVIWVLNGILAEMKTIEPYSPSARASARAAPVINAGKTVGKITRLNVCQREGIRVPYPVRELLIRGGALPVETVVEASG